MDESLAAAVPEEGMALVSALDDALLVRHGAGKLEDGTGMDGEMKALDDVDMDMDIDVDVFRPSAMLDTRLDEEFGSARDFGGLWRNGACFCFPYTVDAAQESTDMLCRVYRSVDGADHGHVDLEHMLLSESDEELLGLIRQEQAAERGGLLCDPLRRRVFAIRAGRIAADGAIDAAQFPPKYSGDTAAEAANGRSVFRHTFGERSQRFGFAGANNNTVNQVSLHPVAVATAAKSTSPVTTTTAVTSPRALDAMPTCDAASSEQESQNEEDEDVDMEVDATATPVVAVATSAHCSPTGIAITIKQEVIKDEPVAFKREAFDFTPMTPVRPQPIARPVDPSSFASPDVTITSASTCEETFHTPLQRSMSSPASSAFLSPSTTSLAEKTSFVSLDRMASIGDAGFAHNHSSSENNLLHASQFRSMSPADELEKVAALHDKGTLGKLDKVEWNSSPGSTRRGDRDDGSDSDKSEQMKSTRSVEGNADRPSIAVVVAGSPATPLPPRYIKGECSFSFSLVLYLYFGVALTLRVFWNATGPTDKEKRRVHSSTFQSFARSFSFSSAPSSSSALD